ncbi:sn-glycerol-3-phosphate ABC transporter ATP-binding protein UgpC [Rubellicoccus peritrichatus]|uniref:Sn-glycerol-3-phosphate ABC transporter ATP-binding protein UgpC n=1 Tax=Rubellicoccus peritrichatus TaxID=3080537 RepID=A0AAQ3LF20_9BACT|nr:sn-glycerol-3-phosphate ABC transporter ATP-binding protein UgpC [Puniceicoccus sp. CR14]WOO43374.1 sn-glycerol-3-phosphate ABC transporter ATP-binding protein UgpC [Puniceicoccus sp. CR14]
MAKVVLEDLIKEYRGDSKEPFRAVKKINLEIRDREFMVLVGPSGCGKSTSLRMIAGLEEITDGTISIGDRVVNNVLPKDRDIAMVFQNYALYPHMTVFDNMAFGLKLMKYPKAEIKKRVDDAADILGLQTMLDRKPKALSGGQRQRVAVGRAIVRKPKVFLFDEPLSNLDAKMRVQMRTEISKLHARLNATMIYVTHDQVEAMTMGDRICVMKDGNIMQVDEPLGLYNTPKNMFVAGFIGSPPMNFFHGRLEADGNALKFIEDNDGKPGFTVKLDDRLSRLGQSYAGKEIVFGVRPEDIADALSVSNPNPDSTISAKVEVSEPMGSETYIYLDTGGHSFTARVHSDHKFDIDESLKVCFDLEKAHLFDPKTENVIS